MINKFIDFIKKQICTTNHKMIGTLYMILGGFLGIIEKYLILFSQTATFYINNQFYKFKLFIYSGLYYSAAKIAYTAGTVERLISRYGATSLNGDYRPRPVAYGEICGKPIVFSGSPSSVLFDKYSHRPIWSGQLTSAADSLERSFKYSQASKTKPPSMGISRCENIQSVQNIFDDPLNSPNFYNFIEANLPENFTLFFLFIIILVGVVNFFNINGK